MIVWVCLIYGTFLNGLAYVTPKAGASAVIDNIASRAECERLGQFAAGGAYMGSYRCIAVRKVKP